MFVVVYECKFHTFSYYTTQLLGTDDEEDLVVYEGPKHLHVNFEYSYDFF